MQQWTCVRYMPGAHNMLLTMSVIDQCVLFKDFILQSFKGHFHPSKPIILYVLQDL